MSISTEQMREMADGLQPGRGQYARHDAPEKAAKALRCAADRIDAQDKRIAELEELIRHCWLHEGYPQSGFIQMTTEQKAIYKSLSRLWPKAALTGPAGKALR